MQDKIVKLGKENEKGLERKMTLLNKQFRNDVDNYRISMNERRDAKLKLIREDLES